MMQNDRMSKKYKQFQERYKRHTIVWASCGWLDSPHLMYHTGTKPLYEGHSYMTLLADLLYIGLSTANVV